MKNSVVAEAFDILYDAYGPQDWWPGDTPWEICVGAVLTQNTNWGNVEKAIDRLKAADVLDPHRIKNMPREDLEEAIRPSGFFRLKADRLLAVTDWWFENVRDDRPVWRGRDLTTFRKELLAVKGVGPETADSILLYCFDQPVFVIDAYTRRVAARHMGIDGTLEYHHLQRVFTDNLPVDVKLYNEYHALLVKISKVHCRKSSCEPDCPLKKLS